MKRILKQFIFLALVLALAAPAWGIDPYPITMEDVNKVKKMVDDPRPQITGSQNLKAWMPEEVWNSLVYDEAEMKTLWAEIVGFKAPEEVGKIAPQIVPGKYSYEDKAKLPFDQLMPKVFLDKFNPPGEGTPNHVMNYTEIEVVPTRQYFYAMPVAEATKKYAGTTRQDDQGYIIQESWKAGLPFPRPSGEHKAMQIVYNHERRYMMGDAFAYFDNTIGVGGSWRPDHQGSGLSYTIKCAGRVWLEPYGFIDARAERNSEIKQWRYEAMDPRDFYGNIYLGTFYTDPKKPFSMLVYVNILRRIRKLSSSDKQDQALGQDITFDDAEGFAQAISPDVYPYEYKVIEEREYLVPAITQDGSEWVDSTNRYEWKGLRFERRPMWKLELKQLDSNYIYSKRHMYVDKETLIPVMYENYDQKGRLYRTQIYHNAHVKPMGLFTIFMACSSDFIDVHSTYTYGAAYPALWLTRQDLSLKSLIRAK